MGLYTTIHWDLDGVPHSCQIKCGWDECEHYTLGDAVPWHILKKWPGEGYLLDGVYQGYGGLEEGDSWSHWWVVIQNHTIQAVVPLSDDVSPEGLREQWGIQDPPEDMWSEAAWQEKRARAKKSKEDWEAYKEAHAHLHPLAMASSYALRNLANQGSFTRVLLANLGIEEAQTTPTIEEEVEERRSENPTQAARRAVIEKLLEQSVLKGRSVKEVAQEQGVLQNWNPVLGKVYPPIAEIGKSMFPIQPLPDGADPVYLDTPEDDDED